MISFLGLKKGHLLLPDIILTATIFGRFGLFGVGHGTCHVNCANLKMFFPSEIPHLCIYRFDLLRSACAHRMKHYIILGT